MTDPAGDRERFALLDRMTSLFASGPDEATLMRGVVDIFVPRYAAWASIDVLDDGAMTRVAEASVGLPGHVAARWASVPGPAALLGGSDRFLHSHAAQVVHLDSVADFARLPGETDATPYHDLLPLSMILAPLRARGERFGLLQVLVANGRRHYDAADLTVVGGVAQRTAFAILHGRLVARLRGELDQRTALISRLEESESRFRRLFAASPIPTWVHDAETLRILAVNDETIAQYGWSEEALLQMTARDLEPLDGISEETRELHSLFGLSFTDGVLEQVRADGLRYHGRSAHARCGGRRAPGRRRPIARCHRPGRGRQDITRHPRAAAHGGPRDEGGALGMAPAYGGAGAERGLLAPVPRIDDRHHRPAEAGGVAGGGATAGGDRAAGGRSGTRLQSGLGLATSYGIVQQSSGHLSVYSEIGRGSTFKIVFPSAVEDGEVAAETTPDGTAPLAGYETVLLVEDDERVRRVSVTALKRHGYVVIESRAAEPALATFREGIHSIDAVVTDVVLPRMNGAQLAKELRAIRPELPILFISGFTENAFTRTGNRPPGIELLEKPFAPEALVRRVRTILDRRPWGDGSGGV